MFHIKNICHTKYFAFQFSLGKVVDKNFLATKKISRSTVLCREQVSCTLKIILVNLGQKKRKEKTHNDNYIKSV